MKTTLIKSVLSFVTALAFVSCAGGPAGTASLAGAKAYPLKTCIVTDNDLGSMGDEQRIVYQERELKFCCAPCVEKFNANPGKYLAKLN
jgi:hypothetical protein